MAVLDGSLTRGPELHDGLTRPAGGARLHPGPAGAASSRTSAGAGAGGGGDHHRPGPDRSPATPPRAPFSSRSLARPVAGLRRHRADDGGVHGRRRLVWLATSRPDPAWLHELALGLALEGRAGRCRPRPDAVVAHLARRAASTRRCRAAETARVLRRREPGVRVETSEAVRRVRRAHAGEATVEVIVCLRDHPELLSRCVDSLLSQTGVRPVGGDPGRQRFPGAARRSSCWHDSSVDPRSP